MMGFTPPKFTPLIRRLHRLFYGVFRADTPFGDVNVREVVFDVLL